MSIDFRLIKCYREPKRECNQFCMAYRDLSTDPENVGKGNPYYTEHGEAKDAHERPLPPCRILQALDAIENFVGEKI